MFPSHTNNLINIKYIKKIFNFALFFLILVFNFANANSTNSSDYQEAIEECQKYIKKIMKKSETVGMAVVVVDSNKIIYSEGFGYSDKDSGKMVSDSTTFRIGSVTKLFTATAIMKLVEEGRVVLDSPITTYLPEFTIKSRFEARPITVRDLLTHESGIPSDIYNGWSIGQICAPEADTMYRTAVSILTNEYVANPPRTVMAYCNIGFSLLGDIVERVSEKKFVDYIEDNIFDKLDMHNSAFDFNNEKVKSNFSKGYFPDGTEDPFYIRDLPAGAMVSSVTDLSHFLKMLFLSDNTNDESVLKRSTIEEMWTPQNADISLDIDTLGITYWLTNTTRIPSPIASHGGDIPPYHAMLGAMPDLKLGVVVLVNSESGSFIPYEASVKLLEKFYEAKTGKLLPKKEKKIKLPKVELSEKQLNAIAGLYSSNNGQTKAIVKRGKIVFDFFGKSVILVPHSDTTASLRYKLFGVIPFPSKFLKNVSVKMRNIDGKQIAVVKSEEPVFRLITTKYVPETPPEEWIKRVGVYEETNRKEITYSNKESEERYKMNTFVLSYDSTTKDLSLFGNPIKTISPTEAITRGVGRGAGETIRAYTEGDQEYLWAWGFALKKVEAPSVEESSKD